MWPPRLTNQLEGAFFFFGGLTMGDGVAVPKLLSVPELADLLGVRPDTLYTWRARGRLPHVKVGGRLLFDPRAISAWLADHAKPVLPAGKRLARERDHRRARREATTVEAANHTGKE